MINLLFDFSRVVLNPKDKNYQGTLNGLYNQIKDVENFNFWDTFEINKDLLLFLENNKTNFTCNVFTSGYIQNDPELRERLMVFENLFSAEELGIKKNDPEAYKVVAELLKVNISDVFFIDDQIENINAAQQAGMKTILYENNPQLFSQLSNLV